MIIRTKKFALGLTAGLAVGGFALPVSAMDNTYYGEARFNELPSKGRASHKIWVGSWWAYTKDGIAYRHKTGWGGFEECRGVDEAAAPDKLVEDGKAFCLSAAEKIDYLAGRLDRVEHDEVKEYQRLTQQELSSLQERIRDLVRKLNRWIDENPGGNWRETDDGKEYLRLNEEMEEKKAQLPEIEIDTATEFERIEHGNGVPGVGGWWGHCNAWAAAALMEEEPVHRTTVEHDGRSVEFTPGEVKALLTEGWMEHHSSFYGSRHDDSQNEGETYADLTPAAFHIYFGTQLGLRQKGFVIDRYTGDQVWNQPVRSYVWSAEKLYDDGPVEKEVVQTEYDRWTGKARKRSLGTRAVYPVQVTAHIHWVTDGLPHEVATVDNMLADVYPTDHHELRSTWGDQVEMRTLTYTLYLDKPMEDPAAVIIGDGEWDTALAGDNHAWPDFAWQPLSQTPSRRDYENPLLRFDDLVVAKILPGSLAPEPSTGSHTFTSQDTPLAIPDADANGIASTIEVDAAGAITGATVTVDITHTYRGDLRVILEKDGRTVELHDRTGGSADDLKKTYDLPQLVGAAAAGTWTLRVVDLAGQDVGKLESWRIELTIDEGAEPDEPEQPTGGADTFAGAGTPLDIPDNDAGGIASDAVVEVDGTLTAVKVNVDITHTWRGDLVVVLEKDGESFVLHNRKGGSADDLRQTFEVPALVGKAARGRYTLRVRDLARQDTGRLNAWSLELAWR